MKTFEQNSIRIGNTDGGIVKGMDELSGAELREWGQEKMLRLLTAAHETGSRPIAFDFKSRQTDFDRVAAVNADD
jgi:hypothetical protein